MHTLIITIIMLSRLGFLHCTYRLSFNIHSATYDLATQLFVTIFFYHKLFAMDLILSQNVIFMSLNIYWKKLESRCNGRDPNTYYAHSLNLMKHQMIFQIL